MYDGGCKFFLHNLQDCILTIVNFLSLLVGECEGGWFLSPAVLSGCTDTMRVVRWVRGVSM